MNGPTISTTDASAADGAIDRLPRPKRLDHVLELLVPLITGKRMLDLGCIGHDLGLRELEQTFYFQEFSKYTSYIKGIDILEKDVEEAQSEGYNIVLGNAETFTEAVPYDVVFAGELIEHLSNAGLFLNTTYINLKNSGKLVITTPNAFSASRLTKCVTGRTNEPPLNDEHTCYYTPLTLRQLAARHGFSIEEIYYSNYDYGTRGLSVSKRASLAINRMLTRLRPEFCQSFIAVLGKV